MIKVFGKCGHRGLGLFCHRCKQSGQMFEEADKLSKSKKKEDREKSVLLHKESLRLKNP